jgi:hypothetical protein
MQYWIVGALGVVAFALASLAAQSWRELLVLAVLSAVLIVPVKRIAAGTWFAADSPNLRLRQRTMEGFVRAVGRVRGVDHPRIRCDDPDAARRPHTPIEEGRGREPVAHDDNGSPLALVTGSSVSFVTNRPQRREPLFPR